jgi:hypothetical protein
MKRAMLITMLLLSTLIAGCGANANKVSTNNETSSDQSLFFVPPESSGSVNNEMNNDRGTQIEQNEEHGNWDAFYNEGLGY